VGGDEDQVGQRLASAYAQTAWPVFMQKTFASRIKLVALPWRGRVQTTRAGVFHDLQTVLTALP